MKQLSVLFCMLALLAGCDDSEHLSRNIDFSLPYVIEDNPDDPVQHERYLIYSKYGVPVYFEDTIQKSNVGYDFEGHPKYRYETLDLNWGFTSHSRRNTLYTYDYLTQRDEQLRGLRYARIFLEESSVKMRPFCIFLVDTVTVKDLNKGELSKPDYVSGFRCLVLAQFQKYDDEDMKTKSASVLREMCKNKILGDDNLVSRFGAVSSVQHYYGCSWSELGISETTQYWFKYSWMFSPNNLYDEGYVDELMEAFSMEREEVEDIRATIMADIGNYGFIRGWSMASSRRSPDDVEEDLGYFVDTILEIGEEEFKARYGVSPLVMEKYGIIADFITTELGVRL